MFDGREVGWNARNASSGGEPLSAPPYATECAMTLIGNYSKLVLSYTTIEVWGACIGLFPYL